MTDFPEFANQLSMMIVECHDAGETAAVERLRNCSAEFVSQTCEALGVPTGRKGITKGFGAFEVTEVFL